MGASGADDRNNNGKRKRARNSDNSHCRLHLHTHSVKNSSSSNRPNRPPPRHLCLLVDINAHILMRRVGIQQVARHELCEFVERNFWQILVRTSGGSESSERREERSQENHPFLHIVRTLRSRVTPVPPNKIGSTSKVYTMDQRKHRQNNKHDI